MFFSMNITFVVVCCITTVPPTIYAADRVGVPRLYTIPFALCGALTFWFMCMPAFGILPIFVELSANMSTYACTLAKEISDSNPDQLSVPQIFRHCLRFSRILKKTSELFSAFLLILTFVLLFGTITSAYRGVSIFFVDITKWEWHVLFAVTGFTIYASLSAFALYTVTSVAQSVIDSNQSLIEAVTNISDINGSNVTHIIEIEDNRKCTFYLGRDQVLSHLKSFKGYDAMGFFVMKKSMLTGIFANFVTYFIILMQFRVTEVTSNKS